AVHHLNLGHGLAGRVIRDLAPHAELSVTLNLHVVRPATDDSADQDAARRIDALGNRAFLGPMLDGSYPPDLVEDTADVTDWEFVRDGDETMARVPLDVLGVNYYTPNLVAVWDGVSEKANADGHADSEASPWVGADFVEFLPQTGPRTAMGWTIDARGLSELLVGLARRYPDLPLMVTVNVAAFDDTLSVDGRILDRECSSYVL